MFTINLKRLVLFFSLTATLKTYAQQDTVTERVNYTRLGIVGTATAAAFVYGYGVQNTMWWKGEKSSFHTNWKQDWVYAMGSDKYGHFYFAHLVSNIYSQLFDWCGIGRKKSQIYGALFALGYQTFIEIRDGFSRDYGFSWGDFTANTIGASLPLLKEKWKFLRDFKFKISYYPSERFKHNSNRHILDDYESTYDWISYPLYKLLPSSVGKFVPKIFNIAIGHSVKKLDIESEKTHEFFIALDWNFEALPGESKFWKILKRDLNFYHFPSPAIKIYPDVIWYGLKF